MAICPAFEDDLCQYGGMGTLEGLVWMPISRATQDLCWFLLDTNEKQFVTHLFRWASFCCMYVQYGYVLFLVGSFVWCVFCLVYCLFVVFWFDCSVGSFAGLVLLCVCSLFWLFVYFCCSFFACLFDWLLCCLFWLFLCFFLFNCFLVFFRSVFSFNVVCCVVLCCGPGHGSCYSCCVLLFLILFLLLLLLLSSLRVD